MANPNLPRRSAQAAAGFLSTAIVQDPTNQWDPHLATEEQPRRNTNINRSQSTGMLYRNIPTLLTPKKPKRKKKVNFKMAWREFDMLVQPKEENQSEKEKEKEKPAVPPNGVGSDANCVGETAELSLKQRIRLAFNMNSPNVERSAQGTQTDPPPADEAENVDTNTNEGNFTAFDGQIIKTEPEEESGNSVGDDQPTSGSGRPRYAGKGMKKMVIRPVDGVKIENDADADEYNYGMHGGGIPLHSAAEAERESANLIAQTDGELETMIPYTYIKTELEDEEDMDSFCKDDYLISVYENVSDDETLEFDEPMDFGYLDISLDSAPSTSKDATEIEVTKKKRRNDTVVYDPNKKYRISHYNKTQMMNYFMKNGCDQETFRDSLSGYKLPICVAEENVDLECGMAASKRNSAWLEKFKDWKLPEKACHDEAQVYNYIAEYEPPKKKDKDSIDFKLAYKFLSNALLGLPQPKMPDATKKFLDKQFEELMKTVEANVGEGDLQKLIETVEKFDMSKLDMSENLEMLSSDPMGFDDWPKTPDEGPEIDETV